ncbi:MAG: hypothetical protein BroJett039_10240 [Chloroflexota bacterium]|nr:MAG: hypothetical protein BroJett039_10240 [Chloroflexota bacterium]
MNVISLLTELQNIDLTSDENARARAAARAKLADTAPLDAARAALKDAAARHTTLESALRALELETGGLTEKLAQVNERLYSGRITNAKELAGLNEDEKMLQRRKGELEDRALALMEQIEHAAADAKQKHAAHERSVAETQTRQEHEHAALRALDASDTELERKRAALRAQLDAATLRAYDHLRATKKGRAVSLIKHSACGQCGFAVPSGLMSRAKVGSELVLCVNCERILAP